MNRYYLTFGYATPQRDHYQVVHAPDYGAARLRVFEEYGPKWAFLYEEKDKADAIDHYGLQPMPTELTTLRLVQDPIEVVPASPEAAA